MSTSPRLDSPGSLHHVMGRGVSGRSIFGSGRACHYFLDKLSDLHVGGGFRVHAWALMPNHYHLLFETGRNALNEVMQPLLSSFGGFYNRVYEHKGHVFMSRFKSILVEREEYLLELVRYIHLNPVRAGIVPSLAALRKYLWTGHRAVVQGSAYPWHCVEQCLGLFDSETEPARKAYLAFLEEGSVSGPRDDLENGNLLIGRAGIVNGLDTRSDQRRYGFQGAVLGSTDFAKRVSEAIGGRTRSVRNRADAHRQVEEAFDQILSRFSLTRSAILGSGRKGRISEARRALCRLLLEIGLSKMDVSRALHLTPGAVTRMLAHPSERALSVAAGLPAEE